MTDEVELTPENAGQLLFGRPARAPAAGAGGPTDVAETRAEASLQQEPEPVEATAGDMASALRGQSARDRREADRALVAKLHPQLEPTDTGGDGAAEPPNANTGEVAAMTARQASDAALVASIHPGVPSGGATDGFDGGAMRGEPWLPFMPAYLTEPQPVSPRQGDGWGPGVRGRGRRRDDAPPPGFG